MRRRTLRYQSNMATIGMGPARRSSIHTPRSQTSTSMHYILVWQDMEHKRQTPTTSTRPLATAAPTVATFMIVTPAEPQDAQPKPQSQRNEREQVELLQQRNAQEQHAVSMRTSGQPQPPARGRPWLARMEGCRISQSPKPTIEQKNLEYTSPYPIINPPLSNLPSPNNFINSPTINRQICCASPLWSSL